MQFLTFEFLIFFSTIFGLAIVLKPHIRIYKIYLLIASLFFYATWSLHFLLILVGNILINYFFIHLLTTAKSRRKFIFVLGILANVAVWGYLKYYNFFVQSLFDILNSLNLETNITVLEVITPLGISFYTFRIVSHLFDNFREKLDRPSLIDFANYVSFFPQIASGPIARAKEFYYDLNHREYKYNSNEIILQILSGLVKKYVFSSFLYEFVQDPFTSPENYSSIDLCLAALGYTAMIYVDFSGYSDLAIAFSKLLGFNTLPNFNLPYKAYDMRGYWRRWHMSLSTWLKDYIYIPLGGSRHGTIRKYFNLLLTMTFAGFWHGAGVNFIVWGVLHGIGLVINQIIAGFGETIKLPKRVGTILKPFGLAIAWTITMIFNTFTRIFFNSRTFASALVFIQGIVSPVVFENKLLYEWRFILLTVFIIGMNFWVDKFSNLALFIMNHTSVTFRFILVMVMLYIIMSLGPEQVPPFIYFKF